MASPFSAQAGAGIFHKNIPGYAPPEPVYETYVDKEGEEKTQKVRAVRCVCVHWKLNGLIVKPERYTRQFVQAGHPHLAEYQDHGTQA